MSGMNITQRQEQFSLAYIRAVASVAGFNTSKPDVDDDSIDLSVSARGPQHTVRAPHVDMQVKGPVDFRSCEEHISYSIKLKNYNDLRDATVMIPRILVVVCLPQTLDDWLYHEEAGLTLRRCGYWVSLRGKPPSDNQHTVTVELPRLQQFTVGSLQAIMDRIGAGGLP
jgi:Domain of unknown function (DUF4365)